MGHVAVFLLAFACGVTTEFANDLWPATVEFSSADGWQRIDLRRQSFLLIAIALDRSVPAMRAALRESNERGDQLALANAELARQ